MPLKDVEEMLREKAYYPDVMVCDKCESPAQFDRMNADHTARFVCVRCKREINVQWDKLVKLSDVLAVVGAQRAQLKKLIDAFPSLTEVHASFPVENMLVWRAKVVEWKKRLEMLRK